MAATGHKTFTLKDYLIQQLPQKPIDTLCRSLGLPGIWEGHLNDTSTIVEVNGKGQIVTVGGVMPKKVDLTRAEEVEVVHEEPDEEPVAE